MKILTLTIALLAALPVAGGQKETKKGADAPKVEKKNAPRQGKPSDGKKKAAAKPTAGAKGVSALQKAELERLLTRYREERREVVAKVNQSHEVSEAMQREIKARTSDLNQLQAELAKTASAIQHLEKKAAAVEKSHEDGHAREEELNKTINELEAELMRRREIAALEKEAAELSRKADALRKKAAELKK